MNSTGFRGLNEAERTLLDAFLAHNFEGADDLRTQVPKARVRPGCSCGCGTLEFETEVASQLDETAVELPVDVEANVLDEKGRVVGGLLLFVKQGRMSSLEIFSVSGDPLPLPGIDRVEWVVVPRS